MTGTRVNRLTFSARLAFRLSRFDGMEYQRLKSILGELSRRVREAMVKAGFDGDPLVRPSQDEKFGHYQSNCAMGLAKKTGLKPRDVAGAIVDQL